MVPVTSPVVSPSLLPGAGLRPTSPVMAEVGTSVISVPASTAKGVAVPSWTVCAAEAIGVQANAISSIDTKPDPSTESDRIGARRAAALPGRPRPATRPRSMTVRPDERESEARCDEEGHGENTEY